MREKMMSVRPVKVGAEWLVEERIMRVAPHFNGWVDVTGARVGPWFELDEAFAVLENCLPGQWTYDDVLRQFSSSEEHFDGQSAYTTTTAWPAVDARLPDGRVVRVHQVCHGGGYPWKFD